MKRIICALLLFAALLEGYGQINMTNSTVQVAGHWNKNETLTVSHIHNSGWVIYSVTTTEITAEGRIDIMKTTITMQ